MMGRARSKQAHNLKNQHYSDATYHTTLYVDDGARDTLLGEMEYRGYLKRVDWQQVQHVHNTYGYHLAREERQQWLVEGGLSYREARSIIEANDDLYESATEVNELNVKNWTKETKSSKISHDVLHSLKAKIERASKLHVCLGGKGLFKRIDRDPVAKQRFLEKRLFLAMGGEADRSQGNASIKLYPITMGDEKPGEVCFEVKVKPFHSRKSARVGYARFTHGGYEVLAALDSSNPVSAQILVKDGVFKLHVTPRVPKQAKPIDRSRNIGGADFNKKRVDVTVIDKRANVVAQHSFPYVKGSDVPATVRDIFKFLNTHNVYLFGIEELSGIQRNKASTTIGHAVPAVRRVVNQLPTKAFEQAVRRYARSNNILITQVDPNGTSKLTPQWDETKFGVDVHLKASFLIARRAAGYSITRGRGQVGCTGQWISSTNPTLLTRSSMINNQKEDRATIGASPQIRSKPNPNTITNGLPGSPNGSKDHL